MASAITSMRRHTASPYRSLLVHVVTSTGCGEPAHEAVHHRTWAPATSHFLFVTAAFKHFDVSRTAL